MSVEDYPIIPTTPHSATKIITAWNSSYYRFFRTVKFDPNACTGVATLKTILRKAVEVGKPAAQLKELTSAEQTAFETCITALMSLISQCITNQIVHDECPATIPGMVSGTDYVLTIDDLANIKDELNNSGLISIPGIEDFVASIVGTHFVLEDPDELRYFPGSKFFQFVPFTTLAGMRTLAATLITNAHLFASYCKKMAIPTISWNSEKIFSRKMPGIRIMSWTKTYEFWHLNAWQYYKNVASAYLFQADSDEAISAVTDADWLQHMFYVYKMGERPNSLNAVVRMVYPYGATHNVIGCCELVGQLCLGITDAFANADIAIASVAINGTDFDWVSSTGIINIPVAAVLGINFDNDTLDVLKDFSTTPNEIAITYENFVPPEYKLNKFGPASGLWDITNYSLEFIFFSHILQQRGSRPSKAAPGRDKWRQPTKKEVAQEE